MRLLALISFAALSGMAPATAAPPADPGFATLEMAAKAVVAAIDSEARTDALFSLFDDEMRKAVPLPQLRGVLGDVRAGLGKVVSRKETSKPEPGTTAYRLAMERGELDMILAVSEDGKIRGLLLRRSPGARLLRAGPRRTLRPRGLSASSPEAALRPSSPSPRGRPAPCVPAST